MILHKKFSRALQRGIRQLYNLDIQEKDLAWQPTRKEFRGTHTFVLFPLISLLKKNPKIIGKEIGEWLLAHLRIIADYQVIQGFLNITLKDEAWITAWQEESKQLLHVDKKEKIIVEIASPNTNKPLHLGHLRNSFLGDAVANLLSAVGHDVTKIMHVNDRGIHICKSMFAYQQDPAPKTPYSSNIKGDHLVGDYYVRFEELYKKEVLALARETGDIEKAKKEAPAMLALQTMLQKWEEGDPPIMNLWKQMNDWVYDGFAQTYHNLRIQFGKTYYESKLYVEGKKMVLEGLKKGIFYQKKDQSIWVNLEAEGLGEKLLLRPDGTAVYITQDLGTADRREEDFHANRSIYVVGNEQDHHFSVLFAILKKLHRPYTKNLEHLSYGMVSLPDGRMKSREGKVVDADDLLAHMLQMAEQKTKTLGKTANFARTEAKALHHMLAIGALKFFFLHVHARQEICFDPEKSIELHGHTGLFIQYTHARIHTMLQKTEPHTIPSSLQDVPTPACFLENKEKDLIAELLQLRTHLHQAATTRNPAIIAKYLYSLAKVYNQLYASLPILKETNSTIRLRRLYLSYITMQTLTKIATWLGIELPTKM